MERERLPELVVFDIAGTTVRDDDAVNRAFRGTLADAGLPLDAAAVNQVMGLPKPEAIRLLLERHGRDAGPERAAPIHAEFTRRMLRFYAEDPSVREMPGAAETFARLRKAGIPVALNTGFSREITEAVLRRLGWEDAVDAVLSSDEVPRGRPHPDMIRQLMVRLGVDDPARVAKVGDTPADLQEGASAGCGWIIGVTGGTHTAEQLREHPHTHLVGSVAELPALFGLPLECGAPAPLSLLDGEPPGPQDGSR
jgi:phosphonatase-like hydrolase